MVSGSLAAQVGPRDVLLSFIFSLEVFSFDKDLSHWEMSGDPRGHRECLQGFESGFLW